MKSRILMCITAMTLFAALAIPVQVSAQHHHYKLIDMGTFGGPTSGTQDELQVLNRRGTVAGSADTSIPQHPNACFFCGDPFISRAFQWRNGEFIELPTLPGLNNSGANWISDSGLIAGFSESLEKDPLTGSREMHAVLWKDGEITDLGTLEGGYESVAFAVNSRGQVAGGGFNTIPDPFSFLGTQQRVFLWQNGIMEDVGTLGGPDAGLLGGFPVFKGNVEMNDRGQVVACSYTSSNPNPGTGVPTVDPFLWDRETGMHDLGGFGGTNGCAIYLNNRGQVVGYSNLRGDLTAHPFLWSKPGPIQDLGTLGGTFGFANWISEAGEVLGSATYEGDQVLHAFVWKNGIMTDLGTVSGDPCSASAAINSKGQIVGASEPVCFTLQQARAFLWENGGPMIDLNAVVPSGSGVQLVNAVDINDRGEIVAYGLLPNGDSHAILLIPCDGNHPGVEDCDYSLVEESATATVSTSPTTRLSPDAIRQLIRSAGFRSRPWNRGFGAQPQK